MQILRKKIWRNQYFFVTLHENKKKPTPGPSLKEKPTPGPSLKGRERRKEKGNGRGKKGKGSEK